ncbi:peptide/nickel transport system ATP-binding protein [Propionicimonas paludicola]|uniref:Peptide/nickel transport system ATP-binding protein n=1 Tax=Propionicimonas paludicola TaxID=185243 RepID=A0A2A9CT49_9ACTN|nr:ABC transporter ATP-binding protein [Propionicimonas paludicola]PFG17617.1 peptide/nickel transport system ATP-binding protein [Propionicimonas paludicola]
MTAQVHGLSIGVGGGGPLIVADLELELAAGEVVGVAGETGSGKTTLGLALLGHLGPGLQRRAGQVVSAGLELLGPSAVSGTQLRSARGRTIAYVPQDPAGALAPHLRLESAFAELHRAHRMEFSPQRRAELFERVGLPSDDAFARRYPHELSGGQQQRVAIALAFCLKPALVVMDEPTTGLDVTTKLLIADLARELAAAEQAAVVFISHDLPLLFRVAQRLVVMHEGRVVETGTPTAILEHAEHPYTQRLLAAWRLGGSPAPAADGTRQVLSVRGLSAGYGDVQILHEVDLSLGVGECLAVVGESGSGKTTTARAISGLHAEHSGRILLYGEPLAAEVGRRDRAQRRAIQYVFQNPWGSLNPRRRVGASVAITAQYLRGLSRAAAEELAVQTLLDVGLRADHAQAMPQHLSGGQRQRAALARALAAGPEVLVCDEVTSSLDASVQADIVALLKRVQAERGLSMVFITHDLALAGELAHRVAVLKDGRLLETGPTAEVLAHPKDPYTAELVRAARLAS